jgi:hypothetical protein
MNRHIILTSGRSGSNYLANTLNQHPQIVNYGEVLASMLITYKLYEKSKKYKNWSVIDYLDYVYNSKTFFYMAQFFSAYSHLKKKKPINFKRLGKIKNLGTKDFFLNYDKKNCVNFLIKNEDIAVIYLSRGNRLRRYLSAVFLKKTHIASSEKTLKVQKVKIVPAEMMTTLKVLDKEIENEKKIVSQLEKNNRLLSIKYEDYFADGEAIFTHNQRVFEFLGVTPLPLKSQHKKILPQRMYDLVENYDEFCACLTDTKYRKYLDD